MFHDVQIGDTKAITAAIKAGGDFNATRGNKESLLKVAVESNQLEVVKALVDNHVNLNAQDDVGETALQRAFELKEIDIAKILVDAGADLNVKDQKGATPFTIAYNENLGSLSSSIILDMLDKGADPKYTKPGDWSLVHFALCDNGSTKLLAKLLQKGMDPNGTELDDSAYVVEPTGIVHDPRVKPKPGPPYIYTAAAHGLPAAVDLLLSKGANPNVKTPSGTYAIFAATNNGLAMLKPFVDHGANLNVKNQRGQTLSQYLQDAAAHPGTFGGVPKAADQLAYIKAHGAR